MLIEFLAAAALDVNAVDAKAAERAFFDAGLAITERVEETNETYAAESLLGEAGGYTFFVRFLDCGPERSSCATVMFAANFGLGRALELADYERIGRYNDSHPHGRAYVFEDESGGNVGVDFVVSLDGGVSDGYLTTQAGKWTGILDDFVAVFQDSE